METEIKETILDPIYESNDYIEYEINDEIEHTYDHDYILLQVYLNMKEYLEDYGIPIFQKGNYTTLSPCINICN